METAKKNLDNLKAGGEALFVRANVSKAAEGTALINTAVRESEEEHGYFSPLYGE
jgi:hypothetical protein